MRQLLVSAITLAACHSAPSSDQVVQPTPPPALLAAAGTVSLGGRGQLQIGQPPPSPPDATIALGIGICMDHGGSCDVIPGYIYYNRDPDLPSYVTAALRKDSVVASLFVQYSPATGYHSLTTRLTELLGAPDSTFRSGDGEGVRWIRAGWHLVVSRSSPQAPALSWIGIPRPKMKWHSRANRYRSDRSWLWERCLEAQPESCIF